MSREDQLYRGLESSEATKDGRSENQPQAGSNPEATEEREAQQPQLAQEGELAE